MRVGAPEWVAADVRTRWDPTCGLGKDMGMVMMVGKLYR